MARVAYIYGRRLAEARDGLALTQRELGEAIGGVSDETISRIERHDIAGILAKRLPRLAAALGITLEQFKTGFCAPPGRHGPSSAPMKRTEPTNALAAQGGLPGGVNMRRAQVAMALPEFQIGVAASRRVDKLVDHPDANRMVGTSDKRAFTAPVDGDCQHPKWKHGEVVVFSYDAVEREGIIPGKSYYIAFVDGSTTFKRLFPDEKDPSTYILRCWNRKKYPKDQPVHVDEVVRIARAISKQVTVDEDGE